MNSPENTNNYANNETATASSDILASLPSFEDHIEHENTSSTAAKINNIANQYSDFKNEITNHQAISFLCELNGIVNNKTAPSEITDGMGIGALRGSSEYVAPNRYIRNQVIDSYIAKINETDDPDIKAQLIYHGIINLHLFEDGNGRTARSAYLLSKNHQVSNNDDIYTTHNYKENNSQDFEEQYNLSPTEQLNWMAEREIINSKVASGDLTPEFSKAEVYSYGLPDKDDLDNIGLTQDEQELLITTIFPDNHLAGIATAIFVQKHNPSTSKSIIDLNTHQPDEFSDHNRIVFTQMKRFNEKYQSVYGKMDATAYRELIDIYNQIKIEQNQAVANIIQEQANAEI